MNGKIQKRIRQYRKDRGLTLRQLAEKVGCTHSYISQVEKGLSVPSLSMVGKLAAALNISVVDLFNQAPADAESDWHLPRAKRKIIYYPDGRVSSQLLVNRITGKRLEPLISIIDSGGTSDEAEKMHHPVGTEEFLLVLKGELHFKINGKELWLREGDSLDFDGALPHSWVNRAKDRAEVLFVFSPPIW
jgi:transcriptional regulator with XRE-family HTH domain